MANPQVENGAIQIAHDLFLALNRIDFTSLERRSIDAVIYLTYGAGKTKAEIQAEDIRYLLGAEKKLRTDRIEEAITKLLARGVLFKQQLSNGSQLLGLTKDYDSWDKMSPTLQGDVLTNSSPVRVGDKMSPPERLLAYAQKKGNFRYGVTEWRIERKYAKLMYIEALERTRDPLLALYLIKDYIDTQDAWFFNNVKKQFTYLQSRFRAWYMQIPRKPREVAENEQATGRRQRYNVKNKQWEEAR